MKRIYYAKDPIDGCRQVPNMSRHGYRWVANWKYWGFCPSYVHEKTKKIIYFHMGKFCTGPEVLRDLEANWCPVSQEEIAYSMVQMKSDLKQVFMPA